jgi:hypothetical protein
MLRIILVLLVLGFYALHQDIWFWRTARPVVFGVLPVGLFYHAVYTAAISLLMWVLVRLAWPGHLDDGDDTETSGRKSPPAASPRSEGGASR